eukprot:GSChrysophyteH1.ASY1.ANO1.1601.1 assembled CDS
MDLSPGRQPETKRRRIIVEDDDSDGNDSNPDRLINEDEIDEDEEGEDLLETWQADYVPAPELDSYEVEHLATDDVRESYLDNLRTRQLADEEIEAREERMRQARLEGDRNEYRLEGLDERAEGRLNLDAFDCPLQEWISESRTRREIQTRFRRFLQAYYTENPPRCPFKKYRPIYPAKIRAMCAQNSASLEVDYGHLVLQTVVTKDFPHYAQIAQELHVRIINLPIGDRLRDLRQNDLNNLIKVSGVVTRRTDVYPQVKSYAYDCSAWVLKVNPARSEYRNYQKINLQESPGSVPPGRVPRYKEVELLGDLIDIARPGEEIDVIGIYCHTASAPSKQGGFPLSQHPDIDQKIIDSIAPSIYGHRHVKTAVALSLFGGCAKQGGNGTHRVRGDINVLLLGDPGTAKSQVLKYAEKTAPRSVFATGKGASAVGLTAGVHRDPLTKEWTLEGGALFDKMNEQDRTSIHEAMEQQTISVSKAGIVTSLQARCAVLAAANPIGGRYDGSFNLAENVELTDPILQRFDVLCVLQDVVDPVADEQLANFVIRSHMKNHPASNPNDDEEAYDVDEDGNSHEPAPIDQETLKKYILYARTYVKPILHEVDSEKVAALYADLRKQSALTGDDVDKAIKVMLDSFLQAQKVAVRTQLQRAFKKYIMLGEDTFVLLIKELNKMVKDEEMLRSKVHVLMENFERKAKDLGVYDLHQFYDSNIFLRHNYKVDKKSKKITKAW